MDNLSAEARSARMALIRSRDTAPEMIVRRALHALGYRFRLHRKDLPGTPDVVLTRHKVAVFVHGCFWHGHDCPRGAREPRQNADYWRRKRARNAERDSSAVAKLQDLGWRVLVIWECQVRGGAQLMEKLSGFLSDPTSDAALE